MQAQFEMRLLRWNSNTVLRKWLRNNFSALVFGLLKILDAKCRHTHIWLPKKELGRFYVKYKIVTIFSILGLLMNLECSARLPTYPLDVATKTAISTIKYFMLLPNPRYMLNWEQALGSQCFYIHLSLKYSLECFSHSSIYDVKSKMNRHKR